MVVEVKWVHFVEDFEMLEDFGRVVDQNSLYSEIRKSFMNRRNL